MRWGGRLVWDWFDAADAVLGLLAETGIPSASHTMTLPTLATRPG